jgi:hypothetical protein
MGRDPSRLTDSTECRDTDVSCATKMILNLYIPHKLTERLNTSSLLAVSGPGTEI